MKLRSNSCLLIAALSLAAIASPHLSSAQGIRPHGFPKSSTWAVDFSFGGEVPAVGDFDGDGLDDIATFYRDEYGGSLSGDVFVSLNSFGAFWATLAMGELFVLGGELPLVGDFNGDGRDDVARLLQGAGGAVFVALSNGSGFGTPQLWGGGFATGSKQAVVGDFNGDGRDDLAEFDPATGAVRVARARFTDFAPAETWLASLCSDPDARPVAGDFDGDGRDDIACIDPGLPALASVHVAISGGSGFGSPSEWLSWILFDRRYEAFVNDFDGDGVDDLATLSVGGDVWVAQSDGTQLAFDNSSVIWNGNLRRSGELCLSGHFNRDLNGDLAVFTRSGQPAPAQGDVRVSLCGDHAPPAQVPLDPFGYATLGNGVLPHPEQAPPLTELPLVLALVEFADRGTFGDPLGRDPGFFESMFFGPDKPNLRDYFLEMSKGSFTFASAGVVWLPLPTAADRIPDPDNPGEFLDVDPRPPLIQKMADEGFDFRPFDKNGNGIVERQELCIATVSNYGDAGGQTTAFTVTVNYPSGPSIVVATGFASADHLGPVDLYAHELGHLLGTSDIYSSNCYNNDSTLQHCNAGLVDSSLVHLDPWHKMALGWLRPKAFDINDGPGMAFLPAAQLADGSALMLYDSLRGFNEHYLLEYRSRECTLADQIWQVADPLYRTPPEPAAGYPNAGYDSDVAGRGIVPWYCRTKPSGGPDEGISKIRPGADGVLDTVVQGDDILVPLDRDFVTGGATEMIIGGPDGVFQSDPKHRITPGPDGILQTSAGGDDVLAGTTIFGGANLQLNSTIPDGSDDVKVEPDALGHDWEIFISTDPQDVSNRGQASNYLAENDSSTLSWKGADTNLVVRAAESSPNWGIVQWGKAFRPFMTFWPDSPQTAPGLLTLQGKFGIRPDGENVTGIFRSVETGATFVAPPDIWTSSVITLELGETLPPGDFEVYFAAQSGASTEIISNVIPITIEDHYEAWRTQVFLSDDDLFDEEVSGPKADFDCDGLNTLAEYVHGGDPYKADPDLVPCIERTASGFRAIASVLASHPGVTVSVHFSDDLITWFDNGLSTYETTYLGDPGRHLVGRGRSFSSVSGGRLFARFEYTLLAP